MTDPTPAPAPAPLPEPPAPPVTHAAPSTPKHLSNKFYDTMKFLAMVVIPALGALYFGLAAIWGLPKPEQVVGSLTVIDTFLGVVLHLSTGSYNASGARFDGVLEATVPGQLATLHVTTDPTDLLQKDQVIFKVVK